MLPIALRPDGRRAVIVGGGNVALRKAEALIAAGFTPFVVAPYLDPRLQALLEAVGAKFAQREYASDDLREAAVAIAATNDDAVNARVIEDAHGRGVLACDAVAPERGDFTMLATVRVGELTFTVDSGASTPAFSKRLAGELEEHFGPEYDGAARTLARMRTYVKAVLSEPSARATVMRTLAALPIAELAHMNPIDAEHRIEAIIEAAHAGAEPLRTSQVVCASRASALAMIQTKTVAARLAQFGIATTILNVTTTGDRVQDRPLAELGSVSVFVKELETALRDRRADYAVHSCKDLPGELAEDMRIAAVSAREDPRDAFCSERFARFEDLPPGAVVGTSSPRRRWQLQALRPDLTFKEIRGNVDTRLRKLREGQFDAIVLAMAGLDRLHARATHTQPFDLATMVPAVAQGALAIETRAQDEDLAARLREAVNDETSELCVRCERAALRRLRAGCDAPIGIHARFVDTLMAVDAIYALPDGPVLHEREERRISSVEEAEALGLRIGDRLLAKVHGYVDPLRPLHGRLLILPRTQERASRIASELRGRGAEVVELRGGDSDELPNRRLPDMLLFPSSGSVAAAAPYLEHLRANGQRPRVAAMGPQSAGAASAAGFAPDAVCADASVEAFVALISEHLQDS